LIEKIVLEVLKECVSDKKTIYYSDLAKSVNQKAGKKIIPEKGTALGTVLSKYLHSLCKQSVNQGKPMIGSVVVSKKNNMPSEGYFKYAEHLYGIQLKSEREKEIFWENELKKLFGEIS